MPRLPRLPRQDHHQDGPDHTRPSRPPVGSPPTQADPDPSTAVTVSDPSRYPSYLRAAPPARFFRVWSLSRPKLDIERENINFRDGFVIFSNGPDHSVQTDVIALSSHIVTRIEEQPPHPPQPPADEDSHDD